MADVTFLQPTDMEALPESLLGGFRINTGDPKFYSFVKDPDGPGIWFLGKDFTTASNKLTGGTIDTAMIDSDDGDDSANISIEFPDGFPVTAAFGETVFQGDFLAAAEMLLSESDTMTGSDGKDGILGFQGDDTILGKDGNDRARGGAGDDTVKGGKGNDTASGGAGNDKVQGGKGKDTINGGTGKDKLTGNADKDSFVFGVKLKNSNADTITDFQVNKDKIVLDDDVFKKIGNSLSKKEFEIGEKADDKHDRIIYDKKSGKLYYDSNGDKSGNKALFATLDKNLKLDHKDFDIIA